jgi:hypothetical protein
LTISSVCCVSARMGIELPRRVAQGLADHLNGALNRTVTPRLPLELVVRNLVSDWGVKPRTEDWLPILEDSAKDFGKPN